MIEALRAAAKAEPTPSSHTRCANREVAETKGGEPGKVCAW